MQGIYSITNKVNGKRYIGLSIDMDRRLKKHKYMLEKSIHTNSKLQRAWNKYGGKAFKFEAMVHVVKAEQLGDVERDMIERYDSKKNGYNCTKGGERGAGEPLPDDIKRKISESLSCRTLDQEWKQKISKTNKRNIKISGENNGLSKIKEEEVIDMRIMFLSGARQIDVINQYGYSRGAIGPILKNRTWKHIPNTLEELLKLNKIA